MVNVWVNDVVNERTSCLRLSRSACHGLAYALIKIVQLIAKSTYYRSHISHLGARW